MMGSGLRGALLGAFMIAGTSLPASPAFSLPITAALDTGLDSDRMVNVRVPGFDFVDNDADTNDRSLSSHGTFQALIFNDQAPSLPYMPLRTYTGNGDTGQMLLGRGQAAVDFALSNRDVKVLMINSLQPIDVGRLRRAADGDVVVLINSGNQARSNPQGSATLIPQLGGRGLIVGGHKSGGDISIQANKPGAAFAEHTITALYDTSRTSTRGTSFSMARVAASAAQVKARDPHLTPFQVVEILKRTAIDAGAPGIDGVYGVGILNARAALEAVGSVEIPDPGSGSSSSSSSSSGAAAAGALLVGGGLYALFKRNKKLKRTLILDEYGRSFWMDMSVSTPKRDRTPSLNLIMADLEREGQVIPMAANDELRSFAVVNARAADLRAIQSPGDYDFRGTDDVSLSFHTLHESGRSMVVGFNDSHRNQFGALSLLAGESRRSDFINTTELTAPFMGFSDQGLSSAFGFSATDRVNVKLGLSANDDHRRWGLDSDSAFVETSYETPRWGVAVQIGELQENGSLFGGASGGAFSVDSARTLSLGLSGRYGIGERTSLIGSYTIGMTNVKHKDPSLLRNFSTLETSSFGAGLVSVDVLKKGDAMGFGVFQPLRVRSGEVDSIVPVARDVEGNIFSDTDRMSLVPDGAERNYELYYSMKVGHGTRVGSHFLYRDEALHDADAERERVLMLTVDRRF